MGKEKITVLRVNICTSELSRIRGVFWSVKLPSPYAYIFKESTLCL